MVSSLSAAAERPDVRRARTLDLPTDSSAELPLSGLQVRVMSTGHSGMPEVQNYMYLVSSSSGSIFHEGDAAETRALDRLTGRSR